MTVVLWGMGELWVQRRKPARGEVATQMEQL
jgi:hypothetical protein